MRAPRETSQSNVSIMASKPSLQHSLGQDQQPEHQLASPRGSRDHLPAANDVATSDATTPLLQRSEPDRQATLERQRRSSFCYRLLLPLILVAVLTGLFRGRLHLPCSPSRAPDEAEQASSLLPGALLSNGTHAFRRTVILISLDGAKPSYLDAGLAPHLQSLGTTRAARRAKYMQPVFPTLTFPNHWTLLTGLFASSHGIVANDFTTTSSKKQFYYTNPAQSWAGEWWLGEPIWATAQRSGISSAVLMWPGPPVTSQGIKPRYFQKYVDGPEWNVDARLNRILDWIDMDKLEERPSLVCAYVPDIDQAAHAFGPESEQALRAVQKVDAFIGKLQTQVVEKRALGDIVDIVVVSDHGMTTTSNDRLILLDRLLGPELYGKLEHRDAWPLAGLRFKGATEAEQRYNTLRAYEKLSLAHQQEGRGWELYWRNDLPSRFHLVSATVEERLAPLWMVPQLGWSITTSAEMSSFANRVYAPIGNHGYDNRQHDMHAIFVASGPSFTAVQEQKAGVMYNMPGFRNVELHNLVSRILGVPTTKRPSTNGTWSFWDPHLRAGL